MHLIGIPNLFTMMHCLWPDRMSKQMHLCVHKNAHGVIPMRIERISQRFTHLKRARWVWGRSAPPRRNTYLPHSRSM